MVVTKEESEKLLEKLEPPPQELIDEEINRKISSAKSNSNSLDKLYEMPIALPMNDGTLFPFPVLIQEEEWKLLKIGKSILVELDIQSWDEILFKLLDLENGTERINEFFGIVIRKDAQFVKDNFSVNLLLKALLLFLSRITAVMPGAGRGMQKTIDRATITELTRQLSKSRN